MRHECAFVLCRVRATNAGISKLRLSIIISSSVNWVAINRTFDMCGVSIKSEEVDEPIINQSMWIIFIASLAHLLRLFLLFLVCLRLPLILVSFSPPRKLLITIKTHCMCSIASQCQVEPYTRENRTLHLTDSADCDYSLRPKVQIYNRRQFCTTLTSLLRLILSHWASQSQREFNKTESADKNTSKAHLAEATDRNRSNFIKISILSIDT